ncbi:acylphosphatase [bacterium]|nr:acylphosphatase [candidate division CSSED10-310 bacterium]
MNDSTVSEKWIVSGRVQRVGFRYFSMRRARKQNVDGGARNLPDGRVEIIAVGTRSALECFYQDILKGPPASVVQSVQRSVLTMDFPDLNDYDVLF